ncbi:MAG: methyltransferase family protein [Terracidiphilus sp.]
MRATAIEFRLRMWIQILIIVLGFWAPWIGALDLSRRMSTLAWLALEISRSGLVSFTVATPIVIVCGAVAALIGAVLRVCGVAYLGYGVVHHGDMQGGSVMAAGPYRYMRNPLYVGGWFMLLAVSLLMPPSGALFSIVLITIQFVRLILGEEAFLEAKLGEPYRDYLRAVPRIVPRLRASLPAAAATPRWLVALGTELNAIGIFFTIAILSWTYDNLLMIKTILIVFGASLVVKALMPREQHNQEV